MSDIVKAIEKEKEYLSFRIKGEEPYHLVDAVKEYGFESLKDYFDAKRDYLFSQLEFEVVETTPDKAIAEVFKAIENKENKVGFINIDYTLVLSGNQEDANVEYCNECNIPIYPYYTNGGSTVATAGDFLLGICMPESPGRNDVSYLLNKVCALLQKNNDSLFEVKGNDILRDGNKILGSAVYRQNGMLVLINYLSFSDKQELIHNICLKHSTKHPGYIDFMTRQQFQEEVKNWTKTQ